MENVTLLLCVGYWRLVLIFGKKKWGLRGGVGTWERCVGGDRFHGLRCALLVAGVPRTFGGGALVRRASSLLGRSASLPLRSRVGQAALGVGRSGLVVRSPCGGGGAM